MSTKAIRVLGLTRRDFQFKDGRYHGRSSELYNGLMRRFDFIGLEIVRKPKWLDYYKKIQSFHPVREQWRQNYHTNQPFEFRARSQRAEQRLNQRDQDYDVIFQLHTMLSPGIQYQNRPYVVTLDNTHIQRTRMWPREALPPHKRKQWMQMEGDVYRHAQYLFPWSYDTRQSLIDDYGVAPERIIVSGAGSNFEAGATLKEDYQAPIALFVGVDFERKGGHVLLDAWSLVRAKLPDAQLLIVGPKFNPLTRPIAGVSYLGRVDDRDRIRELFLSASLFVMPSIFEPWGNVFLEAMGLAIPCIGPNHLGAKDTIVDGETGYHVVPEDVDMLADRMLRVLSDPQHAQQLGHAGYRRAQQQFTWDAVLDRMTPYIVKAAQTHQTQPVMSLLQQTTT